MLVQMPSTRSLRRVDHGLPRPGHGDDDVVAVRGGTVGVSGSTVPNSTIDVPVKFEVTSTWWREIDVDQPLGRGGLRAENGDGEQPRRRWRDVTPHHVPPISRIE